VTAVPVAASCAPGELRSQITFSDKVGTAWLSGAQSVPVVTTSASGVCSVTVVGPSTVNVSLALVGVVSQTTAQLCQGGAYFMAFVEYSAHHSTPSCALSYDNRMSFLECTHCIIAWLVLFLLAITSQLREHPAQSSQVCRWVALRLPSSIFSRPK
jgi:hypothetical protein